MPRWLFILAIAGLTWLALTAYERGVTERAWNSMAEAEVPNWEPAAEHAASDRTQDAFQRAWNSSEKRARKALAENGGGN
jgi:hypothetical protein